jgi:hypothetical protein
VHLWSYVWRGGFFGHAGGTINHEGRFPEDVLQGCAVDLVDCRILAGEADCMLVALGLLHMKATCMIPKELGGDYEPQVSEGGEVS